MVGIVAALPVEARAFAFRERPSGAPAYLEDGSRLLVSGMGCAAAAVAAHTLIEAGVTALASFGMAGGLDPALIGGTIFLPDLVISRPSGTNRGAGFTTAAPWCARLSAAVAGRRPVCGGTLLTSAHALETTAAKREAFRETGAAAVDMESSAVAAIAAAHGIPFIAARVIVDTAADALPGAVIAATRFGRLRFWRLAAALAGTPADIPALVRLARRYRAARSSLGCLARTGALAAP